MSPSTLTMRSLLIAQTCRRSSNSIAVRHASFFSYPGLPQQQLAGRIFRTITTKPVFRKAKEDGSETDIEEEDLYKYTRFRWLCDEPEKMAKRYRKFNIGALTEVAIKALNDESESCVKVLKCIEGQFNKAFLLTMDNGVEVLAKLPNPNAGPEFFTIASEVATRYFLREVLGLPIPRIIASSFDSTNAVGAEYIIEEKACGKQLGSLWEQWPTASKLDFISQIIDLERKLTSVSFPKHGCIYYKADLESRGVVTESLLEIFGTTNGFPPDFDRLILDRFALGPLTERTLWDDERAKMDLDRGPWRTTLEYLEALGMNEAQWVKSYAKPRMNFHRSMESPETPDEYLSLLRRYIKLAPHLIPTNSKETCLRTLSHPDLHFDNVFVDPNTSRITNIIDWQSASASEIFLHRAFLPMLYYSELGETQEQQDPDGNEGQKGKILSQYKHLTELSNPRHWAALEEDHIPILTKPVSLVSGAWNREDVFSFRHALITVVAHWKHIAPDSTPCPIHFTELELELHEKEMELMQGLGMIMHQLQAENMIPLGGMVRPENYEQAQNANNRFKDIFISLAEDEQQRALHSKVWPYQDQS